MFGQSNIFWNFIPKTKMGTTKIGQLIIHIINNVWHLENENKVIVQWMCCMYISLRDWRWQSSLFVNSNSNVCKFRSVWKLILLTMITTLIRHTPPPFHQEYITVLCTCWYINLLRILNLIQVNCSQKVGTSDEICKSACV